MLGWEFYIYRHDLAPDPHLPVPDDRALLASWVVGLGGLDWIKALEQQGKATDLGGNGYPCIFLAMARDVFPVISRGPPTSAGPTVIGDDYVHPSGWIGDSRYFPDRISSCPGEQMLLIHAWDQS